MIGKLLGLHFPMRLRVDKHVGQVDHWQYEELSSDPKGVHSSLLPWLSQLLAAVSSSEAELYTATLSGFPINSTTFDLPSDIRCGSIWRACSKLATVQHQIVYTRYCHFSNRIYTTIRLA